MNGLGEYINKIKKKAKIHLSKEYKTDKFCLNDFELINFYLLDKAINNEKNLFIKTINREQKNETYLPSILSVAISLFYKNYCNNNISYQIGDVLQKNGERFKIVSNSGDLYRLITLQRGGGDYPSVTKNSLDKNYLITNSSLSNRTVKTKLNDYKKLFNRIFRVKNFPSKFQYKAVIILEKKDFMNELKTQSFSEDIDLKKAIPFQWVNKNGKFEKTQIPIEPMIYLVPDYETFKEYILDEGVEVETVIVIGKNKYQEESFRQLKKDLKHEEIPFTIIIGNEDINDKYELFLRWKWTIPEITILRDNEQTEISTLKIDEDNFLAKILSFDEFIKNLNYKYSIELPSFNGFKKLLYSLVMPCLNSRMNNQLKYLQHLVDKTYSGAIEESLLNQNIKPQELISEIRQKTDELTSSFSNSKLQIINNETFDYLIIPDRFSEIWSEESKLRILGYNQFLTKVNALSTSKKILFTSPFGYKHHSQELLDFCRSTAHYYTFITYEEEEKVISTLEKRYKNDVIQELNSQCRKELLGGITFTQQEPAKETESIPELIERIEDKSSISNIYSYDNYEPVNYCIEFENGEISILEGSKSVLIEKNKTKKRRKIIDLMKGDTIRVYSNLSKELLFETATKQDTTGRFKQIDTHSDLWKQCLKNYYDSKGDNYTEHNLLADLKNEGISIKNVFTLKNWLNIESNIRFPHKKADLLTINRTINNSVLNKDIREILESRSIYNGIMIALGRDLSDEIMDFIINKKRGKILNTFSDLEINALANKSAPLRVINQIQITEEDESE